MARPNNNYILKCVDLFGATVVFEKLNYEKHKNKHRELEEPSFCPKRISTALQKPTFTITSKLDDTICYYYEEYSKNDIMMYTKVVVCKKRYIKTAFRIDHVQEIKYGYKPTYYKNNAKS